MKFYVENALRFERALVGIDELAQRYGHTVFAGGSGIQGADAIISLGGDGTMLEALHYGRLYNIPVLGINFGHVGFLTSLEKEDYLEGLEKVFANPIRTFMHGYSGLRVRIIRDGLCVRDGEAVQDVVVRADAGHMIQLGLAAATIPVSDFYGDGLIIATPLGSTAYCLSAGGPIVYPEADVHVLVPICHQGLTMRPLVVPAQHDIGVAYLANSHDDTAGLSTDGCVPIRIEPNDFIEVYRSKLQMLILVPPTERSFYDLLREKYHWGGISRKTLVV